MAAITVPSVASAIEPTGLPPLVFHDVTVFASLLTSIAQMPFGAPPQLPLVATYTVLLTPIRSDTRAFAGTNAAGFWMSLPDGKPSVCSSPLAARTYTSPDERPNPPPPPPPRAGAAPGAPGAAPGAPGAPAPAAPAPAAPPRLQRPPPCPPAPCGVAPAGGAPAGGR